MDKPKYERKSKVRFMYERGEIDHHKYISILEKRDKMKNKRIEKLRKLLRETADTISINL